MTKREGLSAKIADISRRATTFFSGPYLLDVRAPALNLSFRLPSDNHFARLLYAHQSLDETMGNWITRTFRWQGGGTFVDIGANFGWYTCLFSKLAGPEGMVVSFEPEPENLKLLDDSLRRNDIRNVNVIRAALGSEAGELKLYLGASHNPGAHSALLQNTTGRGHVIVPVVTLDDTLLPMVAPDVRISLLKIDIEGFELDALSAGTNVLVRCDHAIVEYSPDMMRAGGRDPAALLRLFRDAGFAIHRPDARSVLQAMGDETLMAKGCEQCDLVLTRQ